jgi:simple sugar transport system permease protein
VGAIETVHAYLREAAASGVAILLLSEDLDEIRALADRILVMYEGEVVGELQAGAASIEEIGLLMAGGEARDQARAPPGSALVVVDSRSARLARGCVRDPGRRSSRCSGHAVGETFRDIVEAGFTGNQSLSTTLISATPILFTGLAAAAAFRMELFNIGAEGQLYLGAVGASWIALQLGDRGVDSTPLFVISMCIAAAVLGAAWALIPGVLRAFANTNEIITSLMLNYVAGLLLTYLIYDSASYWRDTSTLQARAFPQGKPMPEAAEWPSFGSDVVVPLGFAIGIGVAVVLWALYSRTRFGFEVSVIADSPRAARYAGMRTRRKILAVMALSGAVAGIGGASQVAEFSHTLDGSPQGLQAAAFGYTGIVVAALARYNPLAVCLGRRPHRRPAERRASRCRARTSRPASSA